MAASLKLTGFQEPSGCFLDTQYGYALQSMLATNLHDFKIHLKKGESHQSVIILEYLKDTSYT